MLPFPARIIYINFKQNLKGQEYTWTSAVFYFGYFAWSWPSSYLIVRLPIGKYISASVFVHPLILPHNTTNTK